MWCKCLQKTNTDTSYFKNKSRGDYSACLCHWSQTIIVLILHAALRSSRVVCIFLKQSWTDSICHVLLMLESNWLLPFMTPWPHFCHENLLWKVDKFLTKDSFLFFVWWLGWVLVFFGGRGFSYFSSQNKCKKPKHVLEKNFMLLAVKKCIYSSYC